MNDSVDVKSHIYLRTIAKQKVCAEFDLATLSPTSAATRQHTFRMLAYHQAQQWFGAALDPTAEQCKLKDHKIGRSPYL